MAQPITSRDEYDAAMEEAARLMEYGNAETLEIFDALIERIQDFRAREPGISRGRVDALERRIDSFALRREEERFLRPDPDGIGSTFGAG